MPIPDPVRTAVLAIVASLTLALAGSATAQQASRQPVFKSPEAALEQGLGAWRSGFLEHALPALRYAADRDVFLAQFYLARIYSDNGTPYTDHPTAYRIYDRIATEFANIDPDDDQRAPFVARALTALAGYLRTGLPVAGLQPDPARAVGYLRHAAQFFSDEEAQFNLAKHYLDGEGVAPDTRAGLHWLSVLTQRGHAGAQAYLADIYWRGRYNVPRDLLRAFALISVAVENAPDTERIWIEDIYQNIYCGAPSGTRRQAEGVVADWRQKYGRTVTQSNRFSLGALPPQAERACGNGETVAPIPSRTRSDPQTPRPTMAPSSLIDVGASQPKTPAPGR